MGKVKTQKRMRRHKRVRTTVSGTSLRPRLSVYKSSRYIYAQLIDDEKGVTILGILSKPFSKGNKSDKAAETGRALAKLALDKNIQKIVFDRGGFKYSGRVRSLADGAREGGLAF